MNYNEFLHTKVEVAPVSGFEVRPEDIHPALKPHQRDAVEVVRCKECVKRETVLCPMESYDDFPWRASRDDDFCSYGERKAEAAEGKT